ncbi:MAG: hypothetical protein U1F30_05325 [Steroidobacteraceae bacterium]
MVAECAPAFHATLAALLDAVASGRLQPRIGCRLPLARAREASRPCAMAP